jgi:hypothetical protein
MALESRKKHIDGEEYQVTQLPARQGFKLIKRLAHIVVPALGDGANAVLKSGTIPKSLADLDLGAFDFKQIAALMLDRADEDLMLECVDWMAEQTLVDGKHLAKVFDSHFAGKIQTMLKWLAFAVEVNNPDLFAALAESAASQGIKEKA